MLAKIKSILTNKWALLGTLIAIIVFTVIVAGLLIDVAKKLSAQPIWPEIQSLLAFSALALIALAFGGFIIYLISGKISGTNIVADVKTAATAAIPAKPAGT